MSTAHVHSMSIVALPEPIRRLFAAFPLYTYPDVQPLSKPANKPTLWVLPPKNSSEANSLSGDVECLKWQTYLILRGIRDFDTRYDIVEEAGVDGHLPTLQLPSGELLGTQKLLAWANKEGPSPTDDLDGYADHEAKMESKAWISLLEGAFNAGLLQANPKEYTFTSALHDSSKLPLLNALQPPPAPLAGYTAPFPSPAVRVSQSSITLQFREAVEALSDRLSSDEWFLGSGSPTALDALAFAHVHIALQCPGSVKRAVERRANLVAWERKVMRMLLNSSEPGDIPTQST